MDGDTPAALIVHALASTSLCAECLAVETGLDRGVIEEEIRCTRETLVIAAPAERCDGCAQLSVVYQLG